MKRIAKLCSCITFLYLIMMLLLCFFLTRKPDGNLTYDFTETESVNSTVQNFASKNNKSIHMAFPVQEKPELNQCFFDVSISEGGNFCIGEINENEIFKTDKMYNFSYEDNITYIIHFSVLGLKNQTIDFLNIETEDNYNIEGSVFNSNIEGIKYKRENNEDGVKNTLDMSDNSKFSISGKAALFKLNDFVVYKVKQLEGDTIKVIDTYDFRNSAKYLKLFSYEIRYIVCSKDKKSFTNNYSLPHIVLPPNRITLHGLKDLYMENTSGNLLYTYEDNKEICALKSQRYEIINARNDSELIVRELNFNYNYKNNGYIFADSSNVLVDGKSAKTFLLRNLFTIKIVFILLLIYIEFLLLSLVAVDYIDKKKKNRLHNEKRGRRNEKEKKNKRNMKRKVKVFIIGTLLPVITVVIYFFNNCYSRENNNMQYMLNLPSFNINVSKDDKDNKLCHISNKGGSIKEATLTPHMYFSMTNYKVGSHYTIEIKDFFGERMLTEDLYLYSVEQNLKNNGWDILIDRKKEKEGYSFLFDIGERIASQNILISLDLCFEIKYVDFMGEKHEEWYIANYDDGSIHCLNENYHVPLEVYTTDRSINFDNLNYSKRDDIVKKLSKEFESNLLLVKEQ